MPKFVANTDLDTFGLKLKPLQGDCFPKVETFQTQALNFPG
jgi:hypothetical protein